MSKAADEQRENLARIAERRRERRDQAADTAQPVVERAERVKPVRITLDLAPALYNELEAWTVRASESAVKINRSEAMRVLLRRLLEDEDLQAAVLDDLKRRY